MSGNRATTMANAGITISSASTVSDPRTSSVAELRRKAQEHSAALLQSLQAAAAAGFSFPAFNLPPLTLHSALTHSRKSMMSDFPRSVIAANNNNNNDELTSNSNNTNSTMSNGDSHSASSINVTVDKSD